MSFLFTTLAPRWQTFRLPPPDPAWLTASQRDSGSARGLLVSRCRIQTKLPVFPLTCSVYMRKQDCKYPTWMLWKQGGGGEKDWSFCSCLRFALMNSLIGASALLLPLQTGCVKLYANVSGYFKRKIKKKSAAHFHQAELRLIKTAQWILGKGSICILMPPPSCSILGGCCEFCGCAESNNHSEDSTPRQGGSQCEPVCVCADASKRVCVCAMVQACLFIWWNNRIEISWEPTALLLNPHATTLLLILHTLHVRVSKLHFSFHFPFLP